MMNFIFDLEGDYASHDDCFFAPVPATIATKDELLRTLAKALKLPAYFGHNWDALDECLRDFSWIEEFRIVLFHHDAPLAGEERERTIYLNILRDAVDDWKNDEQHEFLAIFDPACREIIDQLL